MQKYTFPFNLTNFLLKTHCYLCFFGYLASFCHQKYTKKGRAIDPSILLYAKVNVKVNLPLP